MGPMPVPEDLGQREGIKDGRLPNGKLSIEEGAKFSHPGNIPQCFPPAKESIERLNPVELGQEREDMSKEWEELG